MLSAKSKIVIILLFAESIISQLIKLSIYKLSNYLVGATCSAVILIFNAYDVLSPPALFCVADVTPNCVSLASVFGVAAVYGHSQYRVPTVTSCPG